TTRRRPGGPACRQPPTGPARASFAPAAARPHAAKPRFEPAARSPTAREPRAARAGPPAPGGGHRRDRASRTADELEAGSLGHVAHFPACCRDLVPQAVRLREILRVPSITPPTRQLGELGRRLLELRDRVEPEDAERSAQKLVVAPAVHRGERPGRVEVVLERRHELRPVSDRLARRAEDVAERLELRTGLLERL